MRLPHTFMRAVCLLGVLLMAGCGKDGVRDTDGAPATAALPGSIKGAQPRPEPLSKYGNHSPYVVFGQTYEVLASAQGYVQRGTASWYGSKFHGRPTSSGEIFDMYKATAAHRSLPLPTYAEVTNLENGRRIIVKINDRGPFKGSRLIDLSYGAAVKLGMINSGTARVKVEAITFDDDRSPAWIAEQGEILQAGAFTSKTSARQLMQKLDNAGIGDVELQTAAWGRQFLYRVWIGPLFTEQKISQVIAAVLELGLERPHRVSR